MKSYSNQFLLSKGDPYHYNLVKFEFHILEIFGLQSLQFFHPGQIEFPKVTNQVLKSCFLIELIIFL